MYQFIAQPILTPYLSCDTHFIRVKGADGTDRYVGNLTTDGDVRLTRSSRYNDDSEIVAAARREFAMIGLS